MSAPVCDTCGEAPAVYVEGLRRVLGVRVWDEVRCEACVWSALEHGHRHVHDRPGDCLYEAERLDGKGFDTFMCNDPCEATEPCGLCGEVLPLSELHAPPDGFLNVWGDGVGAVCLNCLDAINAPEPCRCNNCDACLGTAS